MKEKITIILFDSLFLETIDNIEVMSQFEIEDIVIPQNNCAIKTHITKNYNEKYKIYVSSFNEILIKIKNARNKCFFIVGNISNNELDSLLFECIGENNQNYYYIANFSEYASELLNESNIDILDIRSTAVKYFKPIILKAMTIVIYNTSKNANIFDTHLLLNDKLKQLGCNVLNITDYPTGTFFEYKDMPDSLWDNISLYEKIDYFSKYLSNLESISNPDVVIISVSNDLLPIDRNTDKKTFKEIPFIVQNAVQPDYCIMNILCNLLINNWLNDNNEYLCYKIENDVDCYCVGSMYYDVEQSKEYNRDIFIKCSDETIDELINCWKSTKEVCRYNDINYIWEKIKTKLLKDENIIDILL